VVQERDLTGTDLVVGLHEGRGVAASLAGRLGRDLLLVDDLSAVVEVLAGRARSALLCGGPTLTTADLIDMTATAARSEVQLGVVHGWAGDGVAEAHAEALAAPRVPLPESVLVWSAFAGLPAFRGGSPPTTVLATDATNVPDELVAGHRLVCMETHGNGVDAPLGAHRQLCARRATSDAVAELGRASLPCLHGGPCIRTPDGVADPDRQLSPADLRADVLVWSTCWGLLAADSIFDPNTAIARHLAAGARVGTTLTTLTSVPASPARLLSIAALFVEGRTAGEVATELNRAEDAGRTTPWVVLGDPLRAVFPRVGSSLVDADRLSLRPGVFRLRLTGRTSTPAVVVANGAGTAPEVFLTGWPELGDAVGINRDRARATATEVTVRAVAPDDEHLAALRALWRPRPDLAFVAGFMRWARTSSYLDDSPDSVALERDVELTLARQEQLTAHPHPYVLLSGGPSKLTRLLERERGSWRGLLERVARYFHDFATTSAGAFTHIYAPYGSSTTVPWPHRCPYCGGRTSGDEYRLPTVGTTRTAVHCVVCANIADLGPEQATTVLAGPETVAGRHSARYSVEVRLTRPRESPVALGWLSVQHVPFRIAADTEQVELVPVDEYTLAASASLQIGPDTPPGRYFLLALVVVDGGVTLGRRAVTVAGA
jgi:hypothetical protein